MEDIPEFHPDHAEVQRILEVPLREILDPDSIREKMITIRPEVSIQVPCFYIDGQVIWGATAMMLSELLDVVDPKSGSRG
jgi:hypothetical protein